MLACRESRTVSTWGRPRDGPTSSSKSTEKLTLSCSSSSSPRYHPANSSLTATVQAMTQYTVYGIYCQGYIGGWDRLGNWAARSEKRNQEVEIGHRRLED